MLIPKPRTRALFDTTVDGLKQAGANPTPFEIAWLWELCKRCTDLDRSEDFTRPAFVCGGVPFYHLTIAADLWIERNARQWWPDQYDGIDPRRNMDLLATAYAMAHSYKPEAFQNLENETHSRLVIKTWASRLSCTHSELVDAVQRWIGAPEDAVEVQSPNESRQEPEPRDWGHTLCWLSFQYNQPPQWFLWNCSPSEIEALVKNCPELCDSRSRSSNDEDFEALRLLVAHIKSIGAGHV